MSDTKSRSRRVDVVSLFGGIGGIDLGLTRGDARLRTILFVEIHADAQQVLRERFPARGECGDDRGECGDCESEGRATSPFRCSSWFAVALLAASVEARGLRRAISPIISHPHGTACATARGDTGTCTVHMM